MSQVCDCWGITRKKIEQAVKEHGLTTADEIYDHFEGASCGVCTEDVEAALAAALETEEA